MPASSTSISNSPGPRSRGNGNSRTVSGALKAAMTAQRDEDGSEFGISKTPKREAGRRHTLLGGDGPRKRGKRSLGHPRLRETHSCKGRLVFPILDLSEKAIARETDRFRSEDY